MEIGNHNLKKSSPLYKLDPMLQDGLSRVGDHLSKSCMPALAVHVMIVLKDSHITTLILWDIHEKTGHCGRNNIVPAVPKVLDYHCKFYHKKISVNMQHLQKGQSQRTRTKMADLPKDRLQPDEPPFTHVGTDYFAPFMVKRGRSTVKRYEILFTCLRTGAVHIVIAQTLDTDSCLTAIR